MHATARLLVTLVMDLLVVVAIVVLAHLVIVFFRQVAVDPWAHFLSGYSAYVVAPIGLSPVPTPYGGVFDVNAALTVMLVLVAQLVVGSVRRLMTP